MNFQSKVLKRILCAAMALTLTVQFFPHTYALDTDEAQPAPIVETTAPTQTDTTAPTQADTTAPTQADTTAPTQADTTEPTQADTATEETQSAVLPQSITAALSGGHSLAEGVSALAGTVQQLPQESEASAKAVTAWSWVDELEIIDPETNVATVPGVSADNPIDLETLIGFLPAYVTATVDGAEGTLALAWSCETFPGTATGGRYTFTATLPEGYALAEGVSALILTVDLGGAEYQLSTDSDGYYLITSESDLVEFANMVDSGQLNINGRLTADITSEYGSIIGDFDKPFGGIFDGNNKTITVTLSDYSSYGVGLFGAINGGTVKNIAGAYITLKGQYSGSDQLVGAICGMVEGSATFENVHVYSLDMGSNGATQYVGGLIGYVGEGATVNISKCSNRASIGTTSYRYAGGLIAYAYENATITIENSFNTGDITVGSDGYGGGLIGTLIGGTVTVLLKSCYNTGAVSGTSSYTYNVGALIGQVLGSPVTATNCFILSGSVAAPLNQITSGYSEKDASAFASGEVCYLLNEGVSDPYTSTWFQLIGVEASPVSFTFPYTDSSTGASYYNVVHYGYTGCLDSTLTYANSSLSAAPVHKSFTNGFCDSCDKYEAATVGSDGVVNIANAGQLYWYAAHVTEDESAISSKCVTVNTAVTADSDAILTADIVINEGDVASGSGSFRQWEPIYYYYGYASTFDGQGHTISGVYVNATANHRGLFNSITDGAVIKNVGVINSYFNSYDGTNGAGNYTGGIVGSMSEGSTIENCYISGSTVKGHGGAGGIVGYASGAITITKCWSSAAVDCSSGVWGETGGIIGMWSNASGTLSYCYNTGSATGTSQNRTGGIVGNFSQSGEVTLKSVYSSGSFGSTGGNIFGNVTISTTFTMEDVYWDVGSNSTTDWYYTLSGSASMDGVQSMTTEQFQSGEVAYLLNDSVSGGSPYYQLLGTDLLPHFNATGSNTVYGGYVQCRTMGYSNTELEPVEHVYSDYGFCTNTWSGGTCDAYEPADLVGDAYQLGNAGNLYWFASLVNGTLETTCGDTTTGQNTAANAVLTDNIVVNTGVLNDDGELNGTPARKWTPIGASSDSKYSGDIDGDGHYISGLYFSGYIDSGLIGYIGGDGSVIQNLGIVDSYFKSTSYNHIGGIVGYIRTDDNALTRILNCYNSGTIIQTNTSSNSYIGGIVGSAASPTEISGCHNTGLITGYSTSGSGSRGDMGGILGYSSCDANKIVDCYNTGTVKGSQYGAVGGIVGDSYYLLTIERCYNTGTITSASSYRAYYVGGIVGYGNAQIKYCYNQGTISGSSSSQYISGIIAYPDSSASVESCYSTGTLSTSGSVTAGDIFARENGTFSNNYYLGSESAGAAETTLSKSAEQFASGEVTWLLNGETAENAVFRQDIDNGNEPYDAYPNLTDAIVYCGPLSCQEPDVTLYTNDQSIIIDGHSYDNGFCVNVIPDGESTKVCDQYEPAIYVSSQYTTDTLDDDTPYSAHYDVLGLTRDHYQYYAVTNAGQLYWFAAHTSGTTGEGTNVLEPDSSVNNYDSIVVLDDIDVNPGFTFASNGSITYTGEAGDGLTPRDWIMIGSTSKPYVGTFDGYGHTITGLYSNKKHESVALIRDSYNCTVKDLLLTNVYFAATTGNAGGIDIVAYGTVERCGVVGTVAAGTNNFAGGIAAHNYGTINNCYTDVSVTGGYTRGGIVGKNCAAISNSYTTYSNLYAGTQSGYSVSNSYYKGNATTGAASGMASKSAAQFASGEVTWLLNGGAPADATADTSALVWKQNIDNGVTPYDAYPNFTGAVVYTATNCQGVVDSYSNESGKTGVHSYSEYGFCVNQDTEGNTCDAYEPAISVTADNCAGLELDSTYAGYYAIENAGQLFWAAALVNGELEGVTQNQSANFVLLNDIDLSVAPNGLLWTPLGVFYANNEYQYKGTFDGNYHVVNNVVVKMESEAGFFGRTESATVRNLGVVGADITAYGYRAGIFAGEIHKSTVSNCFAVGKVAVEANRTVQRGAFAGEAAASTLSNCFAWDQSDTPAEFYPNYASDNGSENGLPTSITNSYCYAATDGVTDQNNLDVTYKTADQFASGEVAWLLSGGVTDGSQVWLQTLPADGYPNFTGETVYQILNCMDKVLGYTNTEAEAATGHSYNENGFCTNTDADDNLCNAYQPAVDSDGDGIYEIANAGQLYWFAAHVNLADPTQDDNVDADTVNEAVIFQGDVTNTSVVLTADIDLGNVPDGVTWRPIGLASRDFQNATFDGGGKTIRNFSYAGYTDYPSHVNSYQVDGLFCYAKNAVVKDFTIEGTMKTVYEGGTNKSFGVIGWTVGTTTVSNVHSRLHFDFSEIPIAVQNVGGIVGKCENTTTITGCTFSGTITGPAGYAVTNVGGIAGTLGEGHTATITGCTFSGKIIGTSTTHGFDLVGGIMGMLPKNARATITDCTFTKDASISIERGWKLAGILGAVEYTGAFVTIQRCASWGSIAVNPIEDMQHLSGIVSYVHPSASYLIEDSAFYGSITNLSDTYKVSYAGGFVSYQRAQGNGWTGVIRNCLSVGTFSGLFDEGSIGAIAGRLAYYTGSTNTFTLENNYYRYDSDTDCTAPTPISPYNTTTDTTALPFIVTGETDAIAKTKAELNSGEVTWLLNEQLPASEGDGTSLDSLVWRQALVGNEIDPYPVFDGPVVYPDGEGGYYNVDVIAVNITYGELVFTYSQGDWQPETHTYAPGTWAPQTTGGDLVTVENVGTQVSVIVSHTDEDDDVTVSLKDWLVNGVANTTLSSGTAVSMGNKDVLQTRIDISGIPIGFGSGELNTLGQITVSISQQEP